MSILHEYAIIVRKGKFYFTLLNCFYSIQTGQFHRMSLSLWHCEIAHLADSKERAAAQWPDLYVCRHDSDRWNSNKEKNSTNWDLKLPWQINALISSWTINCIRFALRNQHCRNLFISISIKVSSQDEETRLLDCSLLAQSWCGWHPRRLQRKQEFILYTWFLSPRCKYWCYTQVKV